MAGANQRNRGDISRFSRRRNAFQIAKQQCVIRVVVAVSAAVSRAVYAGSAAQRVNLKPAVVGDGGAVTGVHHIIGLDERVFLESCSVFLDVCVNARFVHGNDVKPLSQNFVELAQFI